QSAERRIERAMERRTLPLSRRAVRLRSARCECGAMSPRVGWRPRHATKGSSLETFPRPALCERRRDRADGVRPRRAAQRPRDLVASRARPRARGAAHHGGRRRAAAPRARRAHLRSTRPSALRARAAKLAEAPADRADGVSLDGFTRARPFVVLAFALDASGALIEP